MPDDGDAVARDILEHPGAVAVLALDEAGRVLLIRQYRHPVGRQLWEIPAGLRDVAGEPPWSPPSASCLRRPATGRRTGTCSSTSFTSPGISTERLRIFLARGLNEVPESERAFVPDHEEAHLLVAWVDRWTSWWPGVLAGELHNGVTALGILSAYAARQGGFTALRDAEAPGVLTGGCGTRPVWTFPATGPGEATATRKDCGAMKVAIPREAQEPRVPRGDHTGRRARARPGRPRGIRREGRRGRLLASATRTSSPLARRSCRHADDVWQTGDLILKVKEPIARSTTGCARARCCSPTCTSPRPGVHRRAARHRASPRSPTRPCSWRTARCRCSPRCPRSPGGWPRRSARTTCSATAAAAAC